MITAAEFAHRVAHLVRMPSVNPLHGNSHKTPTGELQLAAEIGRLAAQQGATVELDRFDAGRANVYALFPGELNRTIAIDVHLDTVSVDQMDEDPFSGRIAHGRVYIVGVELDPATFD